VSKINLREWKLSDAPALTAAINNKKVIYNLRDGIPFPYTEKDAEEFITAALNAKKDSQYAFAITYGGEVIGSIGVFRKEGVHRFTVELGYFISDKYWGKGITTEAVRQICDYIFTNTDIVRIFAEPYTYNTASCRVLEKAGFQFEGILRQNVIKNGQMLDMKLYAIIKTHTVKLYRPVNQAELNLIADSEWTKFPPRLPEQPIFYPVANEAYASQIAKDWNVPSYGAGFVLQFEVDAEYLSHYETTRAKHS
jgi:RimJ/RimL family protein N-acetyltransferase